MLEQGDGGQIVYDENSLPASRNMRTGLSQEEQSLPASRSAICASRFCCRSPRRRCPAVCTARLYPDFVSVREFDEQGRVVRECRFLGLFTSSVYTQSVRRIPFIRRKVETVVQRANFGNSAHLAKELVQVLEVLPRDELFQAPIDELFENAIAIVQIQERNRRGCSCASIRTDASATAWLRAARQLFHRDATEDPAGSAGAARGERPRVLHLFLRIRTDPGAVHSAPGPQPSAAGRSGASRAGSAAGLPYLAGRLPGLVVERFGEAKGTHLLSQFPKGFPAGYRERFSPQSATVDMQHVLDLSEERPLVMSFYQPITAEENRLHCKLYHLDTPLPLSDILPIMENLGLRVLGEFPFQLRDSSGRDYWIHDFAFTYSEGLEIDLLEINEALQDAFIHIYGGFAENDAFNRLVLTAGLAWREVALLRAYARYLKQIRMGFDLGYIASALLNHTDIARELVRLFKMRFYLARKLRDEDLADKQQRLSRRSSAPWMTWRYSTRTEFRGATWP